MQIWKNDLKQLAFFLKDIFLSKFENSGYSWLKMTDNEITYWTCDKFISGICKFGKMTLSN